MSEQSEIFEKKLSIEKGLLGFETITQYSLTEADLEPFMWLKAVDEKNLAFLVVDPFILFPDYEIDIDDDFLSEIDIKNPSDVVVLTILTVSKTGQEPTANLQGPVIVNKNNNKAIQVVLSDPRWMTKHSITNQLETRGA